MIKKVLPVVSRITVAGFVGMLVARFIRFRHERVQKRGFFHRVLPH
jgi:hypothetical protein